jgi:hypothetical protein
LSPSPIHKALSILQKHRVRALLMGGQACILYGAAEFSRDVDLAVLADEPNLKRLQSALAELGAMPVFVPPLSAEVLRRGHACHFRCGAAGVAGLRIDVMSVLHGCERFEKLWARRHTLSLQGVGRLHLLTLSDLVQAKKTQRDKDWPMIRRLLEADYYRRSAKPTRERIAFWLREARTPDIILTLCERYPAMAHRVGRIRPVVRHGLGGDRSSVEKALLEEQEATRTADREYWRPLRVELAQWRRETGKGKGDKGGTATGARKHPQRD